MPSFHATPAPHGWDLPPHLERVSAYMTKATRSLGYLFTFLGCSTVVTVTLGAPYLHYRLYAYRGGNPTERWFDIVSSLDILWDHYYQLPLHILPTLFPMVSSSGLPLCSTATFMATMTLTVGVISVATSSVYKSNAKALRNKHAIDKWLKASKPAWQEVLDQSFWVLISLPGLVFFLSANLFFLTIILTVWERPMVDMTASLTPIQGCSPNKLQAFKVISLVIFAPIISLFVFVLTKIHSITTINTAEVATTA